ncbi:clostripain-related cysteine peptidase (plasmid) [Coraliomargarita sp. W4R53]
MSAERFMWLVAIPLVAVLAVVAVFFNPLAVATTDTSDSDADSSWTFMAYVMGDTNLEPYALDDLSEMASVGSGDEVNIIAMVDRSPDYSDEGLGNLADWEDTKLLAVQPEEFVILDELGELNTGSPETLAGFIETAITEYPADNYALLLWDHGGGWIGMGADETDGEDGLELDEIAQGIDAGLSAAGVDKLDLLGFDACLMATYEVATTLAPHADYMVASEEVEPGHGWDYGQLQVVKDDPSIAPADLAAAMIDGYSAQAQLEGTESDITLGLLDLAAVAELEEAMDAVAEAFVADPLDYTPAFASAQYDVLEFGRDPDPESSTYQIDLGVFLDNLANEGSTELAEHASAARDALDAMVLMNVAGPATSASTGLSIYFPPVENYFADSYLDLAGVPAWPAMLADYFASGQLLDEGAGATFHEAISPTVTLKDGELAVFAAMAEAGADSIVEANVAVGYERDGDFVFVIEMPASRTQQGGEAGVAAEFDLTYLTIGDGVEEELVYQSIGIDPGTGHTVVDIPLEYSAPAADPSDYEDALLSIVIDDDGTIIEEDLFATDSTGTLGAFEPDVEGRLHPVALVATGDGEWQYERTGDGGVLADLQALEYTSHDVSPGVELVFELSVRDFGGGEDFTTVFAEAP